MAEETDRSQKTEEPTQRRLDEARKKGEVATSREVNHWFMIGAATIFIFAFAGPIFSGMRQTLARFLYTAHSIPTDPHHLMEAISSVMVELGLIFVASITVILVLALAAGLVQNGPLFAPELIQPKLSKISLGKGIQRLFSLRSLSEFVKGILKLVTVGTIGTMVMLPAFDGITLIPFLDPTQFLALLQSLAVRLLSAVFAVMTVIAGIDFLYQKFEHHKRMRMSHQEIKEEFRQTEGDPILKSRLRQIRTERARRRMMAAVPEADVVITNPTHYAVALVYHSATMPAPKVSAKGKDLIALRIREVAAEHDVAVVENPALARALFAGVEIDEEIPEQHYRAVAEIIGYVMRMKGKGMPPRPAA
jgi:flagellar biosynthetic protein FlhB